MAPIAVLLVAEWPAFLSRPDTLVLLIPLAAILVGGILGLAKLLIRHRERMAMIEQGLYPDHRPKPDDAPPGRP